MLFTSYRWHLFILYDVIVFYFYFILLWTQWGTDISMQRSIIVIKPPKAQMFLCRGQLLLVNLLRHRCYSANNEYIGESSRIFEERYKEHLKAPSPIFEHQNITGMTTVENFKIISGEDQTMVRAIKEAMYIRVNNPNLSRNIGKYSLPHIWDKVLFSISELKTK